MTFDLAAVRRHFPARRVEWFPTLDSTMTLAAQRVREGEARGLIIGAEQQTAGMGRHGRKWHSAPGAGLYVSLVLEAKPTPILMLALGLAARDAIQRTAGLTADLRWPNDVMLSGRKCAGMLAQVEREWVVAGIGINVNQTEFPEDLDTPATSLRLEGAEVRREELLLALVQSVDVFTQLSASEVTGRFTAASSYARGKQVRAEVGGSLLQGTTCGLDPSGFLRLRGRDGGEHTILNGGVRPV